MQRFRDTVMCGFGVICGAWAVFGAPYMGSTPLLSAIVLTVGVVGIAVWDLRAAVRKARNME